MEIGAKMATKMELESLDANPLSASSAAAKLFVIKNAIQTNFGDDYVFQIAASQDTSTLALSLSSNAIKLYSPATGQYFGECKGHSGTIHEISFLIPSLPSVICSCSSDATVRAWDITTLKQVSSLEAGSSQEIFSFSFGGSTGDLLAAGCNAQILFWDWKQVACLEESHMDDVTQVCFVPNQQNKLMSSSVDGLLCLLILVGKLMMMIIWNHIWEWKDTRREVNFEDARSLASDKWNLDDIDYFVDFYYSGADDRLWVIRGTGSRTLGYFPIDYNSSVAIQSPEAILEGGHAGVVRTVLPISKFNRSLAQNKGIFGWMGGEDGRLCCWLSDQSFPSNSSWITSALVVKTP